MLARISLAALMALALASAPAIAKTKPIPQNDEIACSGVFGPDSSEALVIETFGAKNVVTGIVPGPEGTDLFATTVFGKTPERKLEFVWFDEENRTRLANVELSPELTAPGGVRIGMSVAEVQELNGEPFKVGGFWWDYGGGGIIESGALADTEQGCYLAIRFAPSDTFPSNIDTTKVAGEVQVDSDEPLLRRIDTRVQVLSLGYPWPQDLPQPQY